MAGNLEPVIQNIVENELKGEDVKFGGELVETAKAVKLEIKSIQLLKWVPHSLPFQFEAVKLILKLTQFPAFFCLSGHLTVRPEHK